MCLRYTSIHSVPNSETYSKRFAPTLMVYASDTSHSSVCLVSKPDAEAFVRHQTNGMINSTAGALVRHVTAVRAQEGAVVAWHLHRFKRRVGVAF